MSDWSRISERVANMKNYTTHEITRLSRFIEDEAFLSWARLTSDTLVHIKEAAIQAIRDGLVGGYSEASDILHF